LATATIRSLEFGDLGSL